MPRNPRKKVGRKKGYRRFIGRKGKDHSFYNRKKGMIEHPTNDNDSSQVETMKQAQESVSLKDDSLVFHGFGDMEDHKKPARVLSLFDYGISVGRYCLDKLKIAVQCYYSSEIDEKALKLQRYNFGDKVIPLGCIKNITSDMLRSLGNIDILLAAPPCQGFSPANAKRLGLPGENGKLFKELTRILKDLQKINEENNTKLYFLCENVRSMEKEVRAEITRSIGCEPFVHNAKKYGYMKRARLFWNNFPQIEDEENNSNEGGHLGDILSCNRTANVMILPTLTTTYQSQITGKKDRKLPVLDDGKESVLLTVEKERAFGLPTSFTDGADLSIGDRSKLLGQAWCANSMLEIMKPLTKVFKTYD
ncbi:DNA (cytosine-5)-methyltransferase 3C-like [Thrips palmi]|uniref:DNA (cytosine-5-)-methyltransferase n=1 Tax=Thrips palmi TaxID=161013 RepID=A0A6P8YZP5_THRPL|nr:DNA (cytosine-5)-methyltransferase 3C-like [Thrips palmi]